MSHQKKIDIIYFDAGSGHRSAAVGLQSALSNLRENWQIRTVNVVDVFDYHKRFGRIVRAGIDYFNWQLQRDRVFDLKGLINLSLLFHDLLSPRDIEQIARFWSDSPPDAIASVTPMYNPALYRSVRLANPNTVYITIPVDFEQVKPRYWFTPKIQQHYLNGSDRLVVQAKAAGVPDKFNHRISGMIIDPKCYDPTINVTQEKEKLGLDPTLPTGLVSFGGQGCVLISDIAKKISQYHLQLNMIFLCGRNSAVFQELSHLNTPYRKVVLGYTQATPIYYLQLADFVIGKPGAMTITESLITGTPLIIIKSRGMRPVQRGNEEWVVEHGVGKICDRLDNLVPAINEVLTSPSFRQNVKKEHHQAIFEAAELICSLVEKQGKLI